MLASKFHAILLCNVRKTPSIYALFRYREYMLSSARSFVKLHKNFCSLQYSSLKPTCQLISSEFVNKSKLEVSTYSSWCFRLCSTLTSDKEKVTPSTDDNISKKTSKTQEPHKPLSQFSDDDFTMIYMFPGIVHVRLLSRLKIFQTIATVLIIVPYSIMYALGQVESSSLISCACLTGFACLMLYIISPLSQRVIGVISLNKAETVAKIYHLTFWGRKTSFEVDVEKIVPISDNQTANDVFVRVDTYTDNINMLMSLKYGQIYDLKKLEKIIGKI